MRGSSRSPTMMGSDSLLLGVARLTGLFAFGFWSVLAVAEADAARLRGCLTEGEDDGVLVLAIVLGDKLTMSCVDAEMETGRMRLFGLFTMITEDGDDSSAGRCFGPCALVAGDAAQYSLRAS